MSKALIPIGGGEGQAEEPSGAGDGTNDQVRTSSATDGRRKQHGVTVYTCMAEHPVPPESQDQMLRPAKPDGRLGAASLIGLFEQKRKALPFADGLKSWLDVALQVNAYGLVRK
ncbi:hypothetical protein AB0C02_32325 [Micromonospora sp. NPDC048999]|uniref:hypothetical protein n=1 Tax=Micromonospora sp. NPDC048999 TaxID=3155391 RepID=UPI0033C1BF79